MWGKPEGCFWDTFIFALYQFPSRHFLPPFRPPHPPISQVINSLYSLRSTKLKQAARKRQRRRITSDISFFFFAVYRFLRNIIIGEEAAGAAGEQQGKESTACIVIYLSSYI